MANELNIALAKSGLTVTAQRYQSGSAVGSAISLSEVGSSGFYTGNMTGTAGTYQIAFISASANVGSGSIVWSGSAEVPASTFNAATDTVANVTLCATTTTLTNAPTVPSASAIASQVRTELGTELGKIDQPISSRLAAADYTAPSAAPTVVAIRQEMDANSTKLANLDATISSRLAGSAYTAPTTPPTAAEIATAVEGSLLNEADGQQILNAIVGAIGNQNLSEVSLVAAVRADLERTGGKLDNIPTTAAPSASAVASATRTELSTELSRIDQSISSRLASSSYTAPANSDITAIKTKTDNLPASPAATGDIPSANITAIKAKTDLLNTDRLANVATTAIVGNLIAQANS